LIKSMIVVASTFSNNSLSELHVKYFSRTSFRLQHSSRICLTVREHSQNNSITTREMCDAAVTKLRFDRVQFISRASVPFSLPHFMIVLSELWNKIRGWALHC